MLMVCVHPSQKWIKETNDPSHQILPSFDEELCTKLFPRSILVKSFICSVGHKKKLAPLHSWMIHGIFITTDPGIFIDPSIDRDVYINRGIYQLVAFLLLQWLHHTAQCLITDIYWEFLFFLGGGGGVVDHNVNSATWTKKMSKKRSYGYSNVFRKSTPTPKEISGANDSKRISLIYNTILAHIILIFVSHHNDLFVALGMH